MCVIFNRQNYVHLHHTNCVLAVLRIGYKLADCESDIENDEAGYGNGKEPIVCDDDID